MKKIKLIRLLALVLAGLMLAGMFCACADEKTPGGTDKTKPTGTGTEGGDENEPELYKANIPEGTRYDNEVFTVYAYPKEIFVWKDYDWQNAGMQTSDVINDAVFKRSDTVENNLGITIDIYHPEQYGDPTVLVKAITTGDDTYDIANVPMLSHIKMVQNEQLMDLSTYGSLDLEAAWWDQNIQKDLAIDDKFFGLTGDIGTMYKRSIAVILFNKELMQNEGIDFPYQQVDSKEWTLDLMIELASRVSHDLDANGTYDDQDCYGLVYFADVLCAMELGCGVNYATKNEADIPEMTLNDERTIDVIDRASELLFDTELSYNVTSNGQNEETMWKMFMANQALFYYGELHSAEDMRATEHEFGILPMPLYDTDQEDYHHTINPNVAATLVIPSTNQEEIMTSYIIDSLGAESKNYLTPAYYEKNLKSRVSRDDESSACLDIIISTLTYDMGYLYVPQSGALIRDLCNNKSTDFASKYAGQAAAMDKELETIMEKVAALS